MKENINKNVVLIELGGSHTECMHAQVYSLKKNNYNVYLVCNEHLFSSFPDKYLFNDIQLHANINGSVKSQVNTVWKINKFIKKNDIKTVIFNTTEITIVRNLLIWGLSGVSNYLGIVHNAKRLESSTTFKLMSFKMKKYFVLSNEIKKSITPMPGIKVESFYPIYFPEQGEIGLSKYDDDLWVIVPGCMSPKRKDLNSLLQAMEKVIPSNKITIVLLGTLPENEYPELISRIEVLKKRGCKIITFNMRIPEDVFASYMKKSDIIMPLISLESDANFYNKYRISGAYNLSYGYKIPLLLYKGLSSFQDFANIALYYNVNNIIETLEDIAINRKDLNECKKTLNNHAIYNLETQSKIYIDFINS